MHTMNLQYEYPEKTDQHMVVSKPLIGKDFDKKYPYYQNGFLYRVARKLAFFVAYTVGFLLCYFTVGIRFVGRNNLRKYKKELSNGCVTICNHVFHLDYLCIIIGIRPHMEFFPAWNKKFLDIDRVAVWLAGGIPVPESVSALKAFFNAFDQHMRNKKWIHFYPEGAMWPYYQTIRPFKKAAFSLAVKHNYPVLPLAYRFRNPSKLACFFGAKTPRATLHIGEPIYPDLSISSSIERTAALKAATHHAVSTMAGNSTEPSPE